MDLGEKSSCHVLSLTQVPSLPPLLISQFELCLRWQQTGARDDFESGSEGEVLCDRGVRVQKTFFLIYAYKNFFALKIYVFYVFNTLFFKKWGCTSKNWGCAAPTLLKVGVRPHPTHPYFARPWRQTPVLPF